MRGVRSLKIGSLMAAHNCGSKFWRTLEKSATKAGGAEKISNEGWLKLLEIAREEGLVAVVTDDKGEATPHFAGFFGHALLRQWRWVQRAIAEGWTPAERSRNIENDIISEHLGIRKSTNDYDHHRTAVLQEKNSRKAQRMVRDDDEVIL